ncbi:MAG TPA: heme-binding protein [Steroidobacteraceae bacterium]|nr:heme-binding protein [Steroidobacteraceae bacterium]
MSRQVTTLTLSDARRLIAAGEKKAAELKIPYNIAVVDSGGALISHVRMDGAWLGSIDISIKKAFTARAFDMSTDDLSKASQSGQSLFGINTTNHEKIIIFGGGIPVKLNGVVVGAVGASGGSVVNDIKVAEAAVAAFEEA